MSEENNTQVPATQEPVIVTSIEPAPQVGNETGSAEFNFKSLVKARVAEAAPSIKNNVVQTFADAEISRIEQAVIKCARDVDAARIEVKKIKPDVPETYNSEGGVQNPATFSKATIEKIKAAKKVVSDLEVAIELALVKEDYSKVLQLADRKDKSEQK